MYGINNRLTPTTIRTRILKTASEFTSWVALSHLVAKVAATRGEVAPKRTGESEPGSWCFLNCPVTSQLHLLGVQRPNIVVLGIAKYSLCSGAGSMHSRITVDRMNRVAEQMSLVFSVDRHFYQMHSWTANSPGTGSISFTLLGVADALSFGTPFTGPGDFSDFVPRRLGLQGAPLAALIHGTLAQPTFWRSASSLKARTTATQG